jgi:hypothetical protein
MGWSGGLLSAHELLDQPYDHHQDAPAHTAGRAETGRIDAANSMKRLYRRMTSSRRRLMALAEAPKRSALTLLRVNY